MSVGIIELVSLLLGLNGFGVQANPKAPTADQALEYAVPNADLVAHFDAVSVIPGNYKALTQLADQPSIKSSPELAHEVRDLVTQIEAPRGMVKGMTGIDLTSDIYDVTAFLQYVPGHAPSSVVAVHGRFTPATLDKIAGIAHKTSVKLGAGAWVDLGEDKALALTKDGVLLAGRTALIKERLGDHWRTPPHGPGTTLGYAADVINARPVFAVVVTLSAAARKEAAAKHGDNFGTDLVKRHKEASFAIFHDGIGWTWVDTSKAGMESMAQVSQGVIEVLRAAQIAPRGFADIALGSLESYRGDRRVAPLLAHKAELIQLADTYIGDGTFKAQLDKDPRTNKVTVRLSDRSLAHVLPLGGVLPMVAAGALFMRAEKQADEMPMRMAPPPAPGKAPAKRK